MKIVDEGTIWLHEYYWDSEGSRSHCWFPTYIPWEEYRHHGHIPDIVGKMTHISSKELVLKEEIEKARKALKKGTVLLFICKKFIMAIPGSETLIMMDTIEDYLKEYKEIENEKA